MNAPKIAVIGAGITGLTAAYRLSRLQPSTELMLFEASDVVGGKVRTRLADDYLVEVGADSFLARKVHGVQLCEELGLGDALIGRNPANRRTYILKDDTLHDLPQGLTGLVPTDLDGLRNNSLFSAEAVARIAQEPHVPAKQDDADESVAAFFARRFGQQAFDTLIQPLMGGIYGDDANQLSILAIFPQLRQLEKQHGSVLAGLAARDRSNIVKPTYPPFVSLRGGMGQLIDALVAALPRGTLRLKTPVQQLAPAGDQIALTMPGGTVIVDQVILATTAPVAAQLLQPFDPELATQLTTITYGSSDIVTFAYDAAQLPQMPDGYGFLVPRSEHPTVQACSWSSNKWVGRAPVGKLLARLFLRDHFGAEASRLAADFLEAQFGISAEPQHVWQQSWPRSIPQYTLGHRERVAAIEARVAQHPPLTLAGAYFDGVGIPDCIRRGDQAARMMTNAGTT